MSIGGVKYLIRRGDTFQLRLPIPMDLQGKLQRKELRRSLRTRDAPTAKRRAFRATLLFMELCDSVRAMQDISAAQANEIITAFYTLLNASYTPPNLLKHKGLVDFEVDTSIGAADEYAVEFRAHLEASNLTEHHMKPINKFLSSIGINLASLPIPKQAQILEGVSRAYFEHVRYLEHSAKESEKEYSPEDEIFSSSTIVQSIANVLPSSQAEKTTSYLQPGDGGQLFILIDTFITNGIKEGVTAKGAWGPDSTAMYRKVLQWFSESVGSEIDVRNISKMHGRDFRDNLKTLRKYTSAKTPFAQAMTKNPKEVVSLKNASNHFAYLKTFFTWLAEEGYIQNTPFGALSIKVPTKPASQKRRPFNLLEIEQLLSSPLYQGYKSVNRRDIAGSVTPARDAYFWLPLLLIYTGMRVGEVANIPLSNIHFNVDEPHFHLDGEKQALKTDAATRYVPIHQHLLGFGFRGWISKLKKTNKSSAPLMVHLGGGLDLSSRASKWLNRYIDRTITDDPRLVVHSFRHYAKDCARNALIPDGIQNQIFGHEGVQTVGDSYGSGANLSVLCEQMNKIDFGLSSKAQVTLSS
jgi:integrase